MKTVNFFAFALSFSCALPCLTTAHAQQNRNDGLLPLPPGIARLIAVDAQNILLAETADENGGSRQFFALPVRHVYAGGIARLFGGTVVPTAPFVSPYFNQNNGFSGNNGGFNQNNGFNNNGNFGNNSNNGGFNGNNNFNNVNGRR